MADADADLSAVIYLFKRKTSPPIHLSSPSDGSTPLPRAAEVDEDPEAALSSQSAVTTQTNRSVHAHPSIRSNAGTAGRTATAVNEKKDPGSPRLDLNTARMSLVLEFTSYMLMASAATGTMFTVYTIIGGLSAGFTPSVQSLALGIYAVRGGEETGKLFGGLSMVQALWYILSLARSRYVSLTWLCSGSIISPMLFGFTFSRTVATFPQAIFVLGASVVAIAFLCTLLIRAPKGGAGEAIVVTEDEVVYDEEREMLVPRGNEEAR